jgi:hypothetical protein
VFAFVLFCLATYGINSGRWNLIGAGLAFATLALLWPALSV